MATPAFHPPEPDPNKKKGLTAIAETHRSRGLQDQLHTVLKKRWFRVMGIAFAVFIVLLLALPFLINVNNFRPKIESEATNALGRQVKLGNLSLSLLSGTVGVDDISIADDPAFSKSPFISAKSLKVGVALMPLIFSKELN